jgi:hypothetical protein
VIRTLDEYVEQEGVVRIDFLKIDTEGFELEVLKGACKSLHKIEMIQFEYGGCYPDNNVTLAQVYQFLQHHGFRYFYLIQPQYLRICPTPIENYAYSNYLATREPFFEWLYRGNTKITTLQSNPLQSTMEDVDRQLARVGVVNNANDQELFCNDIPKVACNLSLVDNAMLISPFSLMPLANRSNGGNASICAMEDGQGFIMVCRRINWYEAKLHGDAVMINDNTVVVFDSTLNISYMGALYDFSRRAVDTNADWRGFENIRLYQANSVQFRFTCTTFVRLCTLNASTN